jgi:substrate-binding family protein
MTKTTAAATALLALLLIIALPCWSSGRGDASRLPPEEIIRLGEKMYRDGMLPSGKEMQAVIIEDVHVPGSAFSCVSCHLRSGIGSIEGQILSPPTNGLKLYKPYYQYNPVVPDPTQPRKSMMDNPLAKPLFRTAYTDATLAEAIRGGINPVGRRLNAVMPRYLLDDPDIAILIAYLKTLSAEPSPGVSEQQIRFATVIAGDVPPGQRTEMLAMLEAVVHEHNRKAKQKNRYLNYGTHVKAASFNYPLLTLSRWELTGLPATWRSQLEEYYRKEPVFALLGGLSATDWQPIHEFSEQNKIPCLLPITDLPVISGSDWYTLYFSKGAYQEGETAARYLGRSPDPGADRPVLQIVEDSAGARAVAAGFQDAWKELEFSAPVSVKLPPGEQISATTIRRLSEKYQPSVILLWTSAGTGAALASLADQAAPPARVHVSSTLLQQNLQEIPEQARSFTYISYPYRLTEGNDLFHVNARAWLQKRAVPVSRSRISTRLFSLTKVLLEPFQIVKRDFNPAGRGNGLVIMEEQFEMMMHVKRNYYRDYLFDLIGMMADSNSIDFERISFGPDRRYASRGCYIVQLSPGPTPELIKKSDWIIY